MNYKDLKLEKSKAIKVFDWNGKQISINKYLSMDDKYDIVMIALQKSFEDGIYNPIKLDMFFHLNLVYMYTDLIFDDEDRTDEVKLYDELKGSGFLDKFLQNIDPQEYKELQEDVEEISALKMKYNSTAASVLKAFVEDLPANAEAAQKIVENFDPEKYSAVVNFAKAANGGRSIESK